MPRSRGTALIYLSILLSISLLATPIEGNSGLGSGTVVYAESAHIGTAAASVGATVFAGDKLDTEQVRGGLQIRAGAVRPRGDESTVANVTLLNPRELVVRCSRGAVLIAVEDDVRVIPESTAYRVVLDPEAAAQGTWGQNPPHPPARSKFIWYAIGFTALVTGFALYEALESPDRP